MERSVGLAESACYTQPIDHRDWFSKKVMGMFYLWPVLLLVGNIVSWFLTLFTLPGNWLMVLLAVLYAWLMPQDAAPRLSWWVVGLIAALAVLGEAVEFLTGAAATAKQGGSRKGVVFGVIGAFAGSLIGVAVGVPIPVIGPVIGGLGFAALGAFAGAWLGEAGTEKTREERIAIGKSAFKGRLLGTAGKLLVGAVMVVILAVDSFVDLPDTP